MTPHLTTALACLDEAITALRDADRYEEAPAPVLALCALRLNDLRDVLSDWEVQ